MCLNTLFLLSSHLCCIVDVTCDLFMDELESLHVDQTKKVLYHNGRLGRGLGAYKFDLSPPHHHPKYFVLLKIMYDYDISLVQVAEFRGKGC